MSDRPSPSTFSLRPSVARIPPRIGIPAALALVVVLLGPRVAVDETLDPVTVEGDPAGWVAAREAAVPGIRPGDEAAVVWADPEARTRTPRSLVYLHGFSADRHEMDPVPEQVAAALGANLHFVRLRGHGRDGAAMAEPTVRDWFQDVAAAVAVGRALGDRVVLMGSSTGATLALWAAAREELAGSVAALVLVSPNLMPADANSRILLLPWGGLLARVALGGERCFEPLNAEQARHWTPCYPVEALLPMMGLVERVRTMELDGVGTPTLILYSPEDRVVNPRETERYFRRLTADPRRLVAVEGGDPAHHVLAGDIMAPENNDRVRARILAFLEEAGLGPEPSGATPAREEADGGAPLR